ncbi:MAG: hypothetical protein H6738_14905 [Alphaproteobacteria bacterium]|nr:hypothetical protein [Alphaproteobacteria bacterium]MCB9698066.1 hypothetical protein [Alphaproteobacteria bacterium]
MDTRALRVGLDEAKARGARAAELFLDDTSEIVATAGRGGRPVVAPPVSHRRLAVRVWDGEGRLGAATGDPATLDTLLGRALASASAGERGPGPTVRQTGVLGGLGILDRRLDQITDDDRVEIVVQAERDLRGVDRKLTSGGFGYRERRTVRRYASSRGTTLEEASSEFEVTGRAGATIDGEQLWLDHHLASRSFATAASFPHGTDLGRRLQALGAPPVELSGPIRVVLPALAVGHLFAWLARAFGDDLLADGTPSFLAPSRDRIPRLDTRIHLQDDAGLPGGLRTASFDERGVAPVPLVLLREGVPDGLYLDPERAHQRGARPTGHAHGDGARPGNLLLRAGTRSVNACLADLGGRVLMVDDLDPTGADLRTGRYDGRVWGTVLEGNRAVGSARALPLHGDLGEVLARVVDVCSDTDRIGHVDAPAMIVDGFSAG